MANGTIEMSYADALFSLGEELGTTERIKSDADTVMSAVKENPSYLSLLDSPALSRDERCGMIEGSFGSLERELVNLIKILSEKRSSHLMPKIIAAYNKEYDASRGIERVEAITAVAMTEAQIERLAKKLEGITNKQIIVRNTVDRGLIGGIKLRYLGRQYDATLKSKLDAFEKRLADLVI